MEKNWGWMRVYHEKEYAGIRKSYLEDYYREATGLDAKRINDSAKSEGQLYHDRLKNLDEMKGKGLITGEAADTERGRLGDEYRGRLGIKNPLGNYEKSLRDLEEARKAGDVTPEEFAKRHKELRKKAVGEMQEDDSQRVSLVGAMQVGSQQAYSVIANSQASDPKVAQNAQIIATLDKSDQKLGLILGAIKNGGNALTF